MPFEDSFDFLSWNRFNVSTLLFYAVQSRIDYMKRKVFFSFHYKRDVGRIAQVRNSWVTKGESSTFLDAADWESIKMKGDHAIKGWINEQLQGTSVTIVLIGNETSNRRWVHYEIEQSIKKRNGLIGIYIHSIKDFRTKKTDRKGRDPFKKHLDLKPASTSSASYPCHNCYDWIRDDGYNNIEKWIRKAARQAKRLKHQEKNQ